MGSISVITATYNAAECLPQLIASLRGQTDLDFEWVVADGGSEDRTLDQLAAVTGLQVKVLKGPDFGIYDALNRAIRACDTDYYLVVGADDVLYSDAIANFKSALADDVDIVAASITAGDRVVRPGRGKSWLYGQYEFVAGHAVGTLFRKSLHKQFGFYSRKFPIAADQLFIKHCCQGGIRLCRAEFVAGRFGLEGVSGVDTAGTLCEFFRVQLLTEKNRFLQVMLFLVRLLRHSARL